MRRRHGCGLCSGHGQHIPVGHCQACRTAFCTKHGTWANDQWLCTRCVRRAEPQPTSERG